MNYTKPDVAVLDQAVRVIELHLTQKTGSVIETAGRRRANPSYDLDE